MEKNQLLWQMSAQQFAAFDTHLYLDTHSHDKTALQMFHNYMKAHRDLAREYEAMYGPLTIEGVLNDAGDWLKDPWPWEREAN